MKELTSIGQSNLDWLVSLLKKRLNSSGKAKSIDPNGNVAYIDVDIYGRETLEAFVYLSLSDFNQTPKFTGYSFEDSNLIGIFAEVLIEGATLYALASRALIERGREFQITDNELNLEPPTLSDLLTTQYSTLLNFHWEKLKTIKWQIADFKN
jgi:hypothetical protein